MKKSNKKEGGTGTKALLKNAVRGAVFGMILTAAFIFLFSVLMLTGTLPETLSDTLILVAVLLGSILGGLYCAGKQGGGVVTAGLTAAAAYVILVLLGTMLFRKSGVDGTLTLRVLIAAVAGGCFGGVLKLHRKGKKSKLRR